MIRELHHRDPLLFYTGSFMLLLLVVATLLSIGDTRLVAGINPWIKPMKFMTSITIFLWTIAWFMPDTEPQPRARAMVRWTIASAMVVEIVMIVMQAWRGTESHFNVRTPFDGIVFGVMGIAIVFNTAAIVLFWWIIRRDTPASRAGYLWGIRLGVLLFLVASLEGAVIITNNAHTIGAEDGGPGLPFVNWSTRYGDLRVAHFFGIHAMQALPLLGFFLDRSTRNRAPSGDKHSRAPSGDKPSGLSRNVVIAVSILWLAVTAGLLYIALQGRPLISL
jgi:hypothetical protein